MMVEPSRIRVFAEYPARGSPAAASLGTPRRTICSRSQGLGASMSVTGNSLLVGAGFACGVLIGGAIASSEPAPAGATSAQGQITACAMKKSGAMRLVTSGSKCKKKELAVSWTASGSQGPAGERGPKGAQGERGPVGATGTAGMDGTRGPSDAYVGYTSAVTGTSVTAASVNVPAGEYLAQAVFDQTYTPGNPFTCRLVNESGVTVAATGRMTIEIKNPDTYQLVGGIKLPTAASVRIFCNNPASTNAMRLSNVSLALTQVGDVHGL